MWLFVRYPKCDWLLFQFFKVLIQKIGVDRFLAVGVGMGNHDIHTLPGWLQGSVGYYIDHGKIFDKQSSYLGREVKGLNSSVHTSNSTHTIHCWRIDSYTIWRKQNYFFRLANEKRFFFSKLKTSCMLCLWAIKSANVCPYYYTQKITYFLWGLQPLFTCRL